MITAALIVAAGRGARMGALLPKALLPIAEVSILARAVSAFIDHPRVNTLVVAVSDEKAARAALGRMGERAVLVRGGARRQDSVGIALAAIDSADIVLVHDAARPLVESTVIDAVIEGVLKQGAAIPAIPVADTVKRIGGDGMVAGTVPRDDLMLAQTPQGFRLELLRAAYDWAGRAGFEASDDASLVEAAGGRVAVVPGSPRNFKITNPRDLDLAERLLRGEDDRRMDPHG
jgi:2-C-methyl-D-erythritol 4-phosphate cytidylyltransferase